MTCIPMTTSRLRLVCTCALAFVLAAFLAGCRGSRDAAGANEGFFEPLKTVNRTPAVKPSPGIVQNSNSGLDRMADSLVRQQKEQERRLGALAGQLQLLESSRKGEQRDPTTEVAKLPAKQPVAETLPVSRADDEVIRLYESGQYGTAVDGLQGLIRPGISKDLEDRYHYMLGVSYLHLRQFDRAASSLKVITDRKRSTLRADAYFILGQTYKQLGAKALAKRMFESVLRESPKEALAASAREELKGLALKK
jgi:TolA-binding protein